MILILSDRYDASTHEVIKWLTYFGAKFVVQWDDPGNKFYLKNLSIGDGGTSFTLCLSNPDAGFPNEVQSTSISAFWYRRGKFVIDYPKPSKIDNPFLNSLGKYHEQEINVIQKFLLKWFYENRIFINREEDNYINKFEVLDYAIGCGLKVPDTAIISSNHEASAMLGKQDAIITKANHAHFSAFTAAGKRYFYGKANWRYTTDEIQNIPGNFIPSFVQKYVEKEFELRIFYLDGIFQSMAIFSQRNEKTKFDYRSYDTVNPNRNVPFDLPSEIKGKLHHLFQRLQIKCGSVDMIYTPTGEFYLLEINPIGIFHNLDVNCNFKISKLIAHYLMKNDGQNSISN